MQTTAIANTDKQPPPKFCGKPGRSGPAKGNSNALRHGLKAGQLPKDARYIEYRMNAFRRELETAVMNDKGEVTLTDAAFIQTAMRWERHAALAQRWLTKRHDELKPADLILFSKEIAHASTNRDKAIAALGLNAKQKNAPWLLPAPTNGDNHD